MPPKPEPSDPPLRTGGVINNADIDLDYNHCDIIYREPAINHHHYTLDGAAVLFHDHDAARDHNHDFFIAGDVPPPYNHVVYDPAIYDLDNIVLIYDRVGGYRVIDDDPNHYTVHHNLTGYRGPSCS